MNCFGVASLKKNWRVKHPTIIGMKDKVTFFGNTSNFMGTVFFGKIPSSIQQSVFPGIYFPFT
jgi:hypothetical protein